MIRQVAVQSQRFERYLTRHCASWHAFATFLDIPVDFGDLMLVTECSKTAAWSSVVYSKSSTEFELSFSVGSAFSSPVITGSRSVQKAGRFEHRRSELRAEELIQPLSQDHTVFIKAYRLGTRQSYSKSFASFFMKIISRIPGDNEVAGEVGPPVASSASSQELVSPRGSPGTFVMRPYETVSVIHRSTYRQAAKLIQVSRISMLQLSYLRAH